MAQLLVTNVCHHHRMFTIFSSCSVSPFLLGGLAVACITHRVNKPYRECQKT